MTLSNRWQAYQEGTGDPHVVPMGDTFRHTLTIECWCSPSDDGDIVEHEAYDGRGDYEYGRRKPH